MEREAQKRFPKVGAITVVLVLALALYSARLLLNAPEYKRDQAAELCSAIVPALHIEEAPIEILSKEIDDGGRTARLAYRLGLEGRIGRRRWIVCTFANTAGLYGEPQVMSVETDIGELGPGRLFVIKRWWLDHQDIMRHIGEERGTLEQTPV